MRGQSEAIGLAIIVMLVIGSIVAYTFLQNNEPPENPANDIISDNFGYVLLTSHIETNCGYQLTWRVLENLIDGVDPCTSQTGIDRRLALEGNLSNVVSALDEWGLDYELSVHPLDDPNAAYYSTGECGFARGAVSRYTLQRTSSAVSFALCS